MWKAIGHERDEEYCFHGSNTAAARGWRNGRRGESEAPSRRSIAAVVGEEGVSRVTLRLFAMLSDRGRVRHSNQDACAALPDLGAFVVCDGMGGPAGGEIASQLATERFLNCLAHRTNSASAHEPIATASARLIKAINDANQAVFRHACSSPSLHGMGTTLVALLWEDATASRKLCIAHVGDSRCYRLRAGTLHMLTRDHSLVEEQVRAGVLSQVQANISPMRNIITRAIGTQATIEPEIATCDPQPGDLYLLASDGLTRELDEASIQRILDREVRPALLAPDRDFTQAGNTIQAALDTACHALVDAANANGGHDNITVLLVVCA